jgi:hypothetical protein
MRCHPPLPGASGRVRWDGRHYPGKTRRRLGERC